MHGLVALDADDSVLRPAILWNDQRTAAECAEIEAAVGFERLVSLTGNRALTGFTAPKLLWLRTHEPERLRADRAHPPAEGLRAPAPDRRARHRRRRRFRDAPLRRRAPPWSDEVCEALEHPDGVASVRRTNRRRSPARATRPRGRSGSGIAAPGPVSVVLGTSGVVFAALDSFAADPQARAHVFCHAVPGTWHAMGVMLSAAGSLRWLRDILGGDYAALDREAAAWHRGLDGAALRSVPDGRAHAACGPGRSGARSRDCPCGHGRGALVRAVLEGVAYGLRDSLELLREIGVDARVGRVSGGGARSELWLRIVASVLGLPLELTAVEEGAAYGAALLAGVRAGVWSRSRRGRRRMRPRSRDRRARSRLAGGLRRRLPSAFARSIPRSRGSGDSPW